MNVDRHDPSIHSLSQFHLLVHPPGSSKPRLRDHLFAANQLVRHGCYDRACCVIDGVAAGNYRNETLGLRLERLAKAAEQLRAISGLDAMLADSCKVEKLLSFHSSIFGKGRDSKRLVIVYATAWNNFDVSFPLLHCLIASRVDHIVYVKNPGLGMYATGNHEYGNSIDQMSSRICALIAGMNPSNVKVMGFSGGGYAALHLAAKAGANAFLGLGIKTDFSKDSTLANPPNRTTPRESDYANNTLVNMRELPEIGGIGQAILYFGERDEFDREQALNMAHLPNFTIRAIQQGSHSLLIDLLVAGRLVEVLSDFLDGAPTRPHAENAASNFS